jgi:hypothetical protein
MNLVQSNSWLDLMKEWIIMLCLGHFWLYFILGALISFYSSNLDPMGLLAECLPCFWLDDSFCISSSSSPDGFLCSSDSIKLLDNYETPFIAFILALSKAFAFGVGLAVATNEINAKFLISFYNSSSFSNLWVVKQEGQIRDLSLDW